MSPLALSSLCFHFYHSSLVYLYRELLLFRYLLTCLMPLYSSGGKPLNIHSMNEEWNHKSEVIFWLVLKPGKRPGQRRTEETPSPRAQVSFIPGGYPCTYRHVHKCNYMDVGMELMHGGWGEHVSRVFTFPVCAEAAPASDCSLSVYGFTVFPAFNAIISLFQEIGFVVISAESIFHGCHVPFLFRSLLLANPSPPPTLSCSAYPPHHLICFYLFLFSQITWALYC